MFFLPLCFGFSPSSSTLLFPTRVKMPCVGEEKHWTGGHNVERSTVEVGQVRSQALECVALQMPGRKTSKSEVEGRGRRCVCSQFTSSTPQCSYSCSALWEDSHRSVLFSFFLSHFMGLIRNKPTGPKRSWSWAFLAHPFHWRNIISRGEWKILTKWKSIENLGVLIFYCQDFFPFVF